MENHEARMLLDLKGRVIALDFAVKMLITHLPDLASFRNHWLEVSPSLIDRSMDNAPQPTSQAMVLALAKLMDGIDAELARRR